MGFVGRSGRVSFIKARYSAGAGRGAVTASSRSAGMFYVMADTNEPTLTLNIAEGSNQSKSSYFKCAVSDDLSGVNSYSATLDGEWIALDLAHGYLRHDFREAADGKTHKLVITAVDGVGNSTTIIRSFIR